MRPHLLMFCYAVFIVGTLMSLVIGGAWFGDEEVSILNQLTGVNVVEVQAMGGWSILKMVGAFFNAVLTMITWEYPYLANAWGMIFKLCFLYPITFGVVYGIIELFIPVLQGLASFIRNLLPL